jgi:hypothetical protein
MGNQAVKKITLSIVLACVIGFLVGCSTGGEGIKEGDTGAIIKTLTNKGITVSAQHLNSKMLYDRFGTRNNPFIEYNENPLIVIDFIMSSGSEVRFRLGRVQVDYLSTKSRPVSRIELNSYWEGLLRNPGVAQTGSPGRYRNWSYNTVSQVINKNVLQDTVDIVPGTDHIGLLLLQGIPNRYGTAEITIPFYSTNGKLIHEFILLIDV